jgi:hypothetical protein
MRKVPRSATLEEAIEEAFQRINVLASKMEEATAVMYAVLAVRFHDDRRCPLCRSLRDILFD